MRVSVTLRIIYEIIELSYGRSINCALKALLSLERTWHSNSSQWCDKTSYQNKYCNNLLHNRKKYIFTVLWMPFLILLTIK